MATKHQVPKKDLATKSKASYLVRRQVALAELHAAHGIFVEDGVVYLEGGKNKPPIVLMKAFPVKGYGYSVLGALSGLVLRRVIKKIRRTLLAPMDEVRSSSKFAAQLERLGYSTPPFSSGVNAIAKYACCLAKLRSYTVIETEGIQWLGGEKHLKPIAVLGGTVYGNNAPKVVPIINGPAAYVQQGELSVWQKQLGALVQGNHMLIHTLSFGLAPPLAKLMGVRAFGLLVVGSWGAPILGQLIRHLSGPPGQPSPWSAQSSGLDVLVRQARDRVVTLDEHGEHGGALVRAAMHRLQSHNVAAGPGQGGFGAPDGDAFIFANCGAPVAQAGAQVPSRTHYESQLITLRVNEPYGVVTQLNGADDVNAFVTTLDELMQQHFGLASSAWIEALLAKFSRVQQQVPAKLAAFEVRLAGGQNALTSMTRIERQVLRHFAFIAVVGQLAVALKVLKLEKGAPLRAAQYLYSGWLTQWRGRQVAWDGRPLQILRAFFLEKSSSLFLPLNNWDTPHGRVIAGYMKVHAVHGRLYLVGKQFFEEVLCKDCGVDAMVEALRAADGLVSDPGGRVLSVRMPGGGQGNANRTSFYAIKESMRFDAPSSSGLDDVESASLTANGSSTSLGEPDA